VRQFVLVGWFKDRYDPKADSTQRSVTLTVEEGSGAIGTLERLLCGYKDQNGLDLGTCELYEIKRRMRVKPVMQVTGVSIEEVS
jgi:hypothetical protein